MKCFTCGDVGLVGGCPACGKTLGEEVKETTSFFTEEAYHELHIPDNYKGIEWSKRKLQVAHPEMSNNASFARYCDTLEKVLEEFKYGRIPDQSALIIANKGFSKEIWAYTCMRYAQNAGYSVVPYLDTSELKFINIATSTGLYNKELKSYPSMMEIMESDVMFVTVDCDNYGTALRTLDSLLSKRARRSKSTFIVSRASVRQMCWYESTQNYMAYLEPTRSIDNRRYPVIVSLIS